jgi:P pilus assembly chaperone PapD
MKSKLVIIISTLIIGLLLLLVFTGCSPALTSIEVMPDIYDNGKNVAFIEAKNIETSIRLIQSWVDNNPNVKILGISSDSTFSYGKQRGWLIIYEK